MAQVKSHKRWFHGTSRFVPILEPGMQTKYTRDIPRDDAVYITSNIDYAREYGPVILEVEVDENRLIPDEDSIFGLLGLEGYGGKKTALQKEIERAYRDYDHERCIEEFKPYGTIEEDCPEQTVTEAMEGLRTYLDNLYEDPQSTGTAERMKDFADWIAKKRPVLSKKILNNTRSAAHIGPVKVIRKVK